MIEVLIADDQEMARTGLRQMLEVDPQIRVVGEAVDGAGAIELARRLKPDVCTVDIRMPNGSGIEVTRRLMESENPPAIVIVTTFDTGDYLFEALDAGATGFVLKDSTGDVLRSAVLAAADGESLISPGPTERLISTYLKAPRRDSSSLDRFTDRETDVLRAVCRGLSNDSIARELCVSSSTVKGHVSSLMRKTGAVNRVALVLWASEHTDLAG